MVFKRKSCYKKYAPRVYKRSLCPFLEYSLLGVKSWYVEFTRFIGLAVSCYFKTKSIFRVELPIFCGLTLYTTRRVIIFCINYRFELYIYIYIYIYIYMCVCVCVCIYIYIYMAIIYEVKCLVRYDTKLVETLILTKNPIFLWLQAISLLDTHSFSFSIFWNLLNSLI